MMTMDRPQAQALAALVHSLRDDWDAAGIMSALAAARDKGDAFEVAQAAIHAASVKSNRTPAVIPMSGEHWTRGRALGASGTSDSRPRCPEVGHTSFPADNCGACRSERIAATEQAQLAAGIDDEQRAVNERGARRARAVLSNHTEEEQ